MLLQKIKTDDGEENVHVYPETLYYGDFTLCAIAMSDEIPQYKMIGDPYKGKLREVTCSSCLEIVYFCKSLK